MKSKKKRKLRNKRIINEIIKNIRKNTKPIHHIPIVDKCEIEIQFAPIINKIELIHSLISIN